MDLEKLKKLAVAAGTEHPWYWHADPIKGDPLTRSRYEVTTLGRTITKTYYSDSTALNEAAYIAAANPAVILELIADLEKQTRLNADYAHLIKEQEKRYGGVIDLSAADKEA